MDFTERKIDGRGIFSGRVFDITLDKIKLPNGKDATREKIHHRGGVGVLAVLEDGTVPLVRQFRYGAGKETIEIPAGKLEAGEDPESCGRRELIEECGLEAAELVPLGSILPTPAYCSEKIYLFLARGLTKTEWHLDEDEFLEVVYMPFEKAVEMAVSGEIDDAKTTAALLRRWALCQKKSL